MKTNPHSLLAISCLGLLLTTLSPGSESASDAKPAPPAPALPAAKPLTEDGLIGAWVGMVDLPKDDGGKNKIHTTVALAFYSDGKCGLVFFQPADDIDPKGKKGLTYDYPLTGTWKLKGGVVTLTPDPKEVDPEEVPEVKTIPLALTQPEKNRLVFDLACMVEPKNALKKDVKVTLRPATDQELEKWLGGKRPE